MKSAFVRSSIALFFVLFFVFAARADRVDDFVRAVMRERRVPGAAIAVVKGGKVVKKQGYGTASLEFGVPVTTDTVFEIGSVSKQMTAAAILLLVEDGRVALDEKISKYLPGTPAAWEKVTVRNLLTHTSGVKSYTAIGAGFELSKHLTREEFIRALSAYPLDFEPGARYSYSNSGYNLLGFIIEAASGKNYWDFMRERIFGPLGMNRTSDRDPKYVIKNRASGYELDGGAFAGRDYDLTDLFAAGAIVSTIDDLTKWDAAWRGDTLLKKSSRAEAWKPFVLNDGKPYPYGFGWNVTEFRGHRLIGHSGSTAGFNSQIWRLTDDDLSVIVLTNLGDLGYAGTLARGIAKIYLPDTSLKALKTLPDPDAGLTARLLDALRARLENRDAGDALSANLSKALATPRAKAEFARVAAFGPLTKFSLTGTEETAGAKIYRYKAETAKRLFLWRFAVDKDGKISELALEDEE
ncbi:MAG: beta-lactamase family protein [Acidobacteria bacterium]|nr:beta-lactamase family protein [Acidobacteriota bacterium]